MDNNEDLKLLFTGSEIDTSVLKEILDDNQIPSFVRNDTNSGKAAGFGVGFGSEADVYTTEEHFEKAKALLDEFLKSFEK